MWNTVKHAKSFIESLKHVSVNQKLLLSTLFITQSHTVKQAILSKTLIQFFIQI